MTTPLQDYVAKTIARGRLGFGDVRRLLRDLLPAGIETSEEAELLAALDRAVSSADPTWSEWFVPAFVYFVVSRERPCASLDENATQWLTQVLAGDQEPTKRGAEILREVMEQVRASHGEPATQPSFASASRKRGRTGRPPGEASSRSDPRNAENSEAAHEGP